MREHFVRDRGGIDNLVLLFLKSCIIRNPERRDTVVTLFYLLNSLPSCIYSTEYNCTKREKGFFVVSVKAPWWRFLINHNTTHKHGVKRL